MQTRDEHLNEYTESAVPVAENRSEWAIALVFFGFIIVAGQMVVGGALAGGLSQSAFLEAILIGNAISGLFAAVAGYVGARSRQTFAQLTLRAFPGLAGKWALAYVPVVLIAWYAIETAIFGEILAEALKVGDPGRVVLTLASAAVFSVTAYWGFTGLRSVGLWAVPAIFVLGIYAIHQATAAATTKFAFGAEIPQSKAIALVVGSWVMGALTCVPDLTRYARTAWVGALIGFLGIFIGNSFNHLVGGFGAAAAGEADPARILANLGLIIPGVLFGLANIWTTNDGNLYSASLNAAPMFSVSRRRAVVGCAVAGGMLAVFEPHRQALLFKFLDVLGATAPPLGGVVLMAYWLEVYGMKDHGGSSSPAWLAWGLGVAAAYLVGTAWSFAVGLPVAAIAYAIFARLNTRRVDGVLA